jgi:hypothetical protein
MRPCSKPKTEKKINFEQCYQKLLAAEALWPEKYLRNPKAKAKSADIK